MKTIVIAGSGRKTGKTTTLRKLQRYFPDNIAVKLAEAGTPDKRKPEILLPQDSTLAEILKAIGRTPAVLIIESNTILKKIKPDLSIFADGETVNRKSDADRVKVQCDLIVGVRVECQRAFFLAGKLGLPLADFGKLLNDLEIRIQRCQLGCF